MSYQVHPTSVIDEGAEIGDGTKIWHFCHISSGAKIGTNCILGQNVFIGKNVIIGDGVKIQNNVSVYEGVRVEDNVFLGPSCVFTNVKNPRAEIVQKGKFWHTVICHGATIGANATILCGVVVGKYAFIAAGAVVTKNVPDYALMKGMAAVQAGYVDKEGYRIHAYPDE